MKRGNRSLPVACSFICLVRRMHTHACASVLDKHIDKWADVVLHAAFRRLYTYTLTALWRADRHRDAAHPDQTRHDVTAMSCLITFLFSFLPSLLRIPHYSSLFLVHSTSVIYSVTLHSLLIFFFFTYFTSSFYYIMKIEQGKKGAEEFNVKETF